MSNRAPRLRLITFIALALGLLAIGVARLCVGPVAGWPDGSLSHSLWRLFIGDWAGSTGRDFARTMDLRVAPLVVGMVVGVALACSGVALQALLRNALAEPFILGLSSGAAVGIVAVSLGSQTLGRQIAPQHLAALAGALATMAVVYVAGRRRGVIDPLGLLLTGVVLSTINGALIMLLHYIIGPGQLTMGLSRWMMGYLNEQTMGTPVVFIVACVTLACLMALLWQARAMDVASFSPGEAMSMGVNLPVLRVLLFVIAGILAAGAVVLSGPLAFVGLICPHLARLMLGPTHRSLLIGSALLGAILIVSADTAAVVIDQRYKCGQMPIGIFTAVLGGPIFLWMLRPQLGRGVE